MSGVLYYNTFDLCLLLYVIRLAGWLKHCNLSLSLYSFFFFTGNLSPPTRKGKERKLVKKYITCIPTPSRCDTNDGMDK